MAVGVAELLAQLLREVRREGPDEDHERLDLSTTHAPSTLGTTLRYSMIPAIAVLYRSAAMSSVTFPIVACSLLADLRTRR